MLTSAAAATVKKEARAIARTTVSDSHGRYRAPHQLVGEYEIQAADPGFETVLRKGITLLVSRDTPLLLRSARLTAPLQPVTTGGHRDSYMRAPHRREVKPLDRFQQNRRANAASGAEKARLSPRPEGAGM